IDAARVGKLARQPGVPRVVCFRKIFSGVNTLYRQARQGLEDRFPLPRIWMVIAHCCRGRNSQKEKLSGAAEPADTMSTKRQRAAALRRLPQSPPSAARRGSRRETRSAA